MKRDESIFNYGHAVRQKEILAHLVEPELPEEIVRPVTAAESFLSLVYAIDPITKLPTGDLNYLVSDKANPEVKQWVLQNLMIDTSGAVVPSPPRGLSDDDIANLSRDPHEDINSYMERVNQYAKDNIELYERLTELSRQSVPVEPQEPAVPSE